jgi:hypothetical protein
MNSGNAADYELNKNYSFPEKSFKPKKQREVWHSRVFGQNIILTC